MTHHAKPTRKSRRPVTTLMATLLSLLAACQPRPETAYDVQHPRTAAVRNIGNFNEALRCMDDMFLAQGKQDIYITTAGIPDATGLIAAGTKEMFITAVSRMSAKSNAFRFVDYDPTQLDVQVLSEMVGLHDDLLHRTTMCVARSLSLTAMSYSPRQVRVCRSPSWTLRSMAIRLSPWFRST
jgi:hypothetical protein